MPVCHTTRPNSFGSVFPDTGRTQTARIRNSLRQECRNRGWRLQEKPSIEKRVDGRPLQFLSGEDAVNLYRRSHRARVGVLFTGKPTVLPRPGRARRSERTIDLATFVRYKAYAARLPAKPACISSCLDAYESWCEDTGCENGNDPRCLPFHIFRSGHTDLDTPGKRRRFNEIHGGGPRRRDERDLFWSLGTGPYHGRDVLHVAGHTLQPGFHWDVSVQRDAKTITTPTERWQVSRYINIAPDAHLRGRTPYARKVRIPN